MKEYFLSHYETDKLKYRCSLGELTEEELEYLKSQCDIPSDVALHSITETSLLKIEDRAEHDEALKRFEGTEDDGHNAIALLLDETWLAMSSVQQFAEKIVELRQYIPKKIKPSPFLANEKRDAYIYEQRKKNVPFGEICDYINKNHPEEFLDPTAAIAALKRYCARLSIKYPHGKRGRKTDT